MSSLGSEYTIADVAGRGRRGRPQVSEDTEPQATADDVADVARVDGMVVIEFGRLDRLVLTPLQARRYLPIFSVEIQILIRAVLPPR